MRNEFRGFYTPSNLEFKNLWREGIFIFDTNVLLNLYRYPKEAREEFLTILKEIKDRIWIPHQVALEYQQNRLSVIAEQVQKYDEVRKIVNDAESELKEKFAQLQLKKRHSHIKQDNFLSKTSEVFQDFLKELERLEVKQPDIFSEDLIRNEIENLFRENIGARPESQARLDAIYAKGKIRYDIFQPPGYCDRTKNKGEKFSDKSEKSSDDSENFTFGGLLYRKEFGDLIVWEQIIEEAKKRAFANVVFITDDEKEDWWLIKKFKGKKTIGPRPELVSEIYKEANVTGFYMYTPERFMKYANEFLPIHVKEESINQVRDVSELTTSDQKKKNYKRPTKNSVREAVLNWLNSTFNDHTSNFVSEDFPIHIASVDHIGNQLLGFEVKHCSMYSDSMFSRVTGRMLDFMEKNSKYDTIYIVFTFEDIKWVEKLSAAIKNYDNQEGLNFLAGLIDRSDPDNITFTGVGI